MRGEGDELDGAGRADDGHKEKVEREARAGEDGVGRLGQAHLYGRGGLVRDGRQPVPGVHRRRERECTKLTVVGQQHYLVHSGVQEDVRVCRDLNMDVGSKQNASLFHVRGEKEMGVIDCEQCERPSRQRWE